MRRKEVLFAVIGGVVGAVLTMAAGSFAPLRAQDESNVEEITCTGLKVVDAAGRSRVVLGVIEGGGVVGVLGKDGGPQATMSAGDIGGHVGVWNKDGHLVAGMAATFEHAGRVYVSGKDGDLPQGSMTASEDEAAVNVFGKDGNLRAFMRIDVYGNGAVGTCDKNGDPLATLK